MAYNADILESITKFSIEFNNNLDNLYFELNSVKQSISVLNNKLSDTAASIDNTINKINNIIKDTDEFNKSNLSPQELYMLSSDLKFLVHKMQESEKYLFDLKYFNEQNKYIV
ncbi:Protein SlyX [Clostridium neonatale]|uniref:hypothetical protein n=1 Tax=Clostridium neonatale TaxID=137838 RepID=UPI00291B524C|nr:Protein SlyX [Clostridium neonatale]